VSVVTHLVADDGRYLAHGSDVAQESRDHPVGPNEQQEQDDDRDTLQPDDCGVGGPEERFLQLTRSEA
jgi:hypothetical protein